MGDYTSISMIVPDQQVWIIETQKNRFHRTLPYRDERTIHIEMFSEQVMTAGYI